jgi:hypothetical protein
MLRTIPVALICLATLQPIEVSAQHVQWLTSAPINWLTFPTTPANVVSAPDPDHVYVSRLDAITYTYVSPLGSNTVSRQAADGSTMWSLTLGDSVRVENIASDDNGHVFVGGRYFKRLLVNGSPVLSVPAGHSAEGSFLCAWDANGLPLWQQDVSGGPLDNIRVSALALDHQGRMWAALNTFFEAQIVRLNSDGTQAESRTIIDAKLIGSISFDPWGGLYVSGAAESPDITVNGTTFAVPHDYAFFVTRMNAAGAAQWVRSAADITFQEPVVQADASGHAYLLGIYYQPLTWGTIPFADPLWSQGFYLARLDSLGSFEWGIAPPYTPGSGQFSLANGSPLGVDADGNCYVLGNVNGTFDWGNGIVMGAGPDIIDRSIGFMSFDTTGAPRWGLSGGSATNDPMYGLSVAANGVAHLCGIAGAVFTLDGITLDPGSSRGSIVARVDTDLNTGLFQVPATSQELIAQPTVFTTGFRLSIGHVPVGPSTSVMLFDATGRLVQVAKRSGTEWGQGLASGCYTVVAMNGGSLLRTRVVKE